MAEQTNIASPSPGSQSSPLPAASSNTSTPSKDSITVSGSDGFEKWIENFYKECGREVTLAYTTLNQMKNWAIAIVAAFISAVVALGKPGQNGGIDTAARIDIYAAAVVAYVFNLRFFVRAILCYINLVRWNHLQSKILSVYFVPKPGENLPSTEQAKIILREEVEEYYHRWLSPISRKNQLLQNLKLGFALVLALPLFFVIIWSVEFWNQSLVRGLFVFALGATIVEFTDFIRSSYFDTPENAKSRSSSRLSQVFPVPIAGGGYLITWLLNLGISATVALWPTIKAFLVHLLPC